LDNKVFNRHSSAFTDKRTNLMGKVIYEDFTENVTEIINIGLVRRN